jgi:hypothetical protein
MSQDSPAALIFDASNGPATVKTDGSDKRLCVDAKITSGTTQQVQLWDATNGPASVITDGSIKRLAVSSAIASTLTSTADFLRRSWPAGAYTLVVDGSVTPVVFHYPANATSDINLVSLNFAFSTGNFDWNGAGFGDGAGLTNGVLVEIVVNNGTTIVLGNVQLNEDFMRLSALNSITQAGVTDHLSAVFLFTGNMRLKAGTADRIRVTIRDNLTLAARDVKYLTATFKGELVA